jgi:hypothetical protein
MLLMLRVRGRLLLLLLSLCPAPSSPAARRVMLLLLLLHGLHHVAVVLPFISFWRIQIITLLTPLTSMVRVDSRTAGNVSGQPTASAAKSLHRPLTHSLTVVTVCFPRASVRSSVRPSVRPSVLRFAFHSDQLLDHLPLPFLTSLCFLVLLLAAAAAAAVTLV